MARLIILAAFFAGSLATYPGGGSYGGGGYGGGGYGGGGWDSSNKNTQGKGGDDKVIEISIHVISLGAGGSAPMQDMAAPMMPPGQTHTVIVGGTGKLFYTPDTIMAEIGDMVQFNFMAKNHTVTQSTFPLPCIKMEGGVDSGFMPAEDGTSPPPSFLFQVMTKKPIWFYCRQKTHCGKGMTFSINPTAEKSQAIFKQMAIDQNGTASGVPPPPAMSPPYPISSAVVTTAAGTAPIVTTPPPPPPPPPASTALPIIVPPPPVNNNNGVPPPSSMVQGSGSGASGACECSCFCGMAAYPPGVGMGMWGGLPGSVPAS